jgi:hypothetical protein
MKMRAVILFALLASPAAAQDIRGMEACGAEKLMERRTGCLQANVEYLQQELIKLKRETNDKLAAAGRVPPRRALKSPRLKRRWRSWMENWRYCAPKNNQKIRFAHLTAGAAGQTRGRQAGGRCRVSFSPDCRA